MEFKRFHPTRTTTEIRDKHADVILQTKDFIYPYFVTEGVNRRDPVSSLKGIDRFSVDQMLNDMEATVDMGIDKVLLFGVVGDTLKTIDGSNSWSDESVVPTAIRAIKQKFPQLTVITDVCLCAYTTHGHCGLLNQSGGIENDLTLPKLAAMALAHARAGADVVAPSAMMDGQVKAIRSNLDAHGFSTVQVMGYSAKYASGFYGPFRDAAQSAPGQGDRKSYQMDFRTKLQGVEEVAADVAEGAASVMVKPAHTYLDVIARVKARFPETPLAAYHTSGEYMMIVAAGEKGLLNEPDAMREVLTAIKRAGADYIISYYAREFAKKASAD
jgi:porphobilinogen synthase